MASINAKEKLPFQRSKQFDRDYWEAADGGYTTNAAAQHVDVERFHREQKETRENIVSKDPEVLAFAREFNPELEKMPTAKERGRRDNVANLFQSPKLRPDESSTKRTFVDQTKHSEGALDKKHFMKRDAQTDYYECFVQYKHTMRT